MVRKWRDGGFTPGPSTLVGDTFGELFVGDFDGDGNADLASIHTEPGRPSDVRILYGDGTGNFSVSLVCCDDHENIAPADVNGDGITDLVATDLFNGVSGFLHIHYGSRSRTFTQATVSLSRPSLSIPPVVADINGDGIPDLVLRETSDPSNSFPWFVSVKLGNGDGTYKPEQDIYSSNLAFGDPVAIRATLDTKPDLVIRQTNQSNNLSSSDAIIFLNNSIGNFPGCQAPNAFTGIHVCSPGTTASASPVHFSIGASGQTPMRKVEVWVDGTKNAESLRNFSQYAFLDADLALASGTHSIDVFAAGWDNLLQHTSFSLAVAPPPTANKDFAIAVSPASATVRAGQAASYSVNIAAQNGFTGAVSFACSGLPTGAACVFNPNPLTVAGAGGTATLQITTTGAVASWMPLHPASPASGQSVLALLASASFGVFGLFFMAGNVRQRNRRNYARLAGLAVMLFAVLSVAGCGGGSSSVSTTPPATGTVPPVTSNLTPAGTYTVTVTGTSGALQHAATVQLVVQ